MLSEDLDLVRIVGHVVFNPFLVFRTVPYVSIWNSLLKASCLPGFHSSVIRPSWNIILFYLHAASAFLGWNISSGKFEFLCPLCYAAIHSVTMFGTQNNLFNVFLIHMIILIWHCRQGVFLQTSWGSYTSSLIVGYMSYRYLFCLELF